MDPDSAPDRFRIVSVAGASRSWSPWCGWGGAPTAVRARFSPYVWVFARVVVCGGRLADRPGSLPDRHRGPRGAGSATDGRRVGPGWTPDRPRLPEHGLAWASGARFWAKCELQQLRIAQALVTRRISRWFPPGTETWPEFARRAALWARDRWRTAGIPSWDEGNFRAGCRRRTAWWLRTMCCCHATA